MIAGIPTNLTVTVGNGQVLCQWQGVAGAVSYNIQRYDIYNNLTSYTSPIPQYIDTAAAPNTQYYYSVASVNGSGTSGYTAQVGAIPTGTGIMSLQAVRIAAQQRADRVNSQFVTLQELNQYVNQSYFELYDVLITLYEDLYVAPSAMWVTDGSTNLWPLPDGTRSYLSPTYQSFVAPPFYKLLGVDLGLSTSQQAFVTVNKFNFIDRNRFVYPNTASTMYGVFNLQYRLLGNNIDFIPTPTAGQPIRIWYIPRLTELLLDTDTLDGISGWTEYVIVDVAIKILQKEESDVSVLMAQKQALLARIESSAINRDAGQPDRISDVRGVSTWGSYGTQGGPGGACGGW